MTDRREHAKRTCVLRSDCDETGRLDLIMTGRWGGPLLEGFASLLHGFAAVLTPLNLALLLAAIVLGAVVGVLPGFGGAVALAVLLPVTFAVPPTSAAVVLAGPYWGVLFGGVITTILFNVPGEPWSVPSALDGHRMAQEGRAGQALSAAFSSSAFGALSAVMVIALLAPLAVRLLSGFGPPEIFAVQVLTFAGFVAFANAAPYKTIVSICLGFALAAVGLDSVTGQLRMPFGFNELLSGVHFLIAMLGLFGIAGILRMMESGMAFKSAMRIGPTGLLQIRGKFAANLATVLRGVLVGCCMGIKPGDVTPASLMSYALARRLSKKPRKFDRGTVEGVAASETAAHAAGTTALLPMMTLGVHSSPIETVLQG